MPPTQAVDRHDVRFIRTLFGLIIVAFLFQFIGLAGPGWIVFSITDHSGHIGIWFGITCVKDTCKVVWMTDDNLGTKASDITGWKRYQILTTAGAAISLLTFMLVGCTRQSGGYAKFVMVSILTPISGACSLTASILVLKEFKLFDGDSPYQFPWALLLTGLGGILLCITMLVSIYFIAKKRARILRNIRNNMATANQNNLQSQTYPAGFHHNVGYSPPTDINQTYGATGGNALYPNLPPPYSQNAGDNFASNAKPLPEPTAPPLELVYS